MGLKFLAFTYKIPSSPSKNRVYIWRAVKNLGSIYLQQGVALFPYKEDILLELKKLNELAKSFNGKSTLSELSFLDENEENDIILEFKNQSIKEYLEFDRNCKSVIYELDRESEENNFTFYELEESEENFKKLNLWLDKISKRDYFNCNKFDLSSKLLANVKTRIKSYGDEVYKRETSK